MLISARTKPSTFSLPMPPRAYISSRTDASNSTLEAVSIMQAAYHVMAVTSYTTADQPSAWSPRLV